MMVLLIHYFILKTAILFSFIFCHHLISPNIIETSKKVGRIAYPKSEEIHSCPSLIYCQGELLHTVQKQQLYPDSKTFVDMSQKNDESVTLENFQIMMSSTNNKPSKEDVRKFVDNNFEFVMESEKWTPKDFNQEPSFLNKIKDVSIKKFAKSLVSLWPLLGRKTKDSVKQNPQRHSLIPVPEGFIVPGGRFREIYYWDSYWIMKGLLISEMTDTVKGMLTNFIFLIKQYNLIPNGSRIYYINRSQPPLFTLMVGLYIDYTNDLDWLKTNIKFIETELNFWLQKRTLILTSGNKKYSLAHYGTDSNTARPESYAEDLATCEYTKTKEDKQGCYNALKTAAETGWDFSTRWIFDDHGGIKANLSYIDSKRVIPVDLNSFLCKSFRLLGNFYSKIENNEKKNQWHKKADEWQESIKKFLYDDTDGIWYDYDYDLQKLRNYFWPSNFAPLWADCYDLNNKIQYGKKALAYYNKMELYNFIGGVPTSLENSGEQWDLPNAWPPLQEFIILGLDKTGYSLAQEVAAKVAFQCIKSYMIGFDYSGSMYEKYDAIIPGQYGGGGEYEVQLGFGWSNGVALSLIDQFAGAQTIKLFAGKWLYIILALFLVI